MGEQCMKCSLNYPLKIHIQVFRMKYYELLCIHCLSALFPWEKKHTFSICGSNQVENYFADTLTDEEVSPTHNDTSVQALL